MDLPFTLPDWLPAWAFLLLALPALLYLFVFLLMPFSVFGVKARLEAVEDQLEAVQDELRALARGGGGPLPRPRLDEDFDVPNFGLLKSAQAHNDRVAPSRAATEPTPVAARHETRPVPRPRRMEPRLD